MPSFSFARIPMYLFTRFVFSAYAAGAINSFSNNIYPRLLSCCILVPRSEIFVFLFSGEDVLYNIGYIILMNHRLNICDLMLSSFENGGAVRTQVLCT